MEKNFKVFFFITTKQKQIIKFDSNQYNQVTCWNPTIPSSYIQFVQEFYPEWHFHLSPNLKYLAIYKDDEVEIRSSENFFKSRTAVYKTQSDRFPKFRRFIWSDDSSIFAIASSNGNIEIVNNDGVLQYILLQQNSTEFNKVTGYIQPIASLGIQRSREDIFNGHYYQFELLVLSFTGIIRSYLFNRRTSHSTTSNFFLFFFLLLFLFLFSL